MCYFSGRASNPTLNVNTKEVGPAIATALMSLSDVGDCSSEIMYLFCTSNCYYCRLRVIT